MLEPKTHFEQVPLEIIKGIIEEQIEAEIAIEPVRVTKKKTAQARALSAKGNQRRGKR